MNDQLLLPRNFVSICSTYCSILIILVRLPVDKALPYFTKDIKDGSKILHHPERKSKTKV